MKKNTFKWGAKDTYWLVDTDANMMLYGGDDLNFAYSEYVRRDAIGRNAEAYYAWRDHRFIDGIKSCWHKVYRKGIKRLLFGDYYYQGQRYPAPLGHSVGMSRDHVLSTIYAYSYAGEDVQEFIKHLRWRISDFANFTIHSWLYIKLLQGKWWAKAYYPITYIDLKLWRWWNKTIYKLTGMGELGQEQHPDEFKPILIFPRAKVLDGISSILFPNYTLRHRALQWHLLPDSKWLRKLKSLVHPMVPKYNYALKLLLGHPDGVTQAEIDAYQPMTGDRWSDVLNPWLNYGRDIHIIKGDELLAYNLLDKDYLQALYDEHANKGCK